MSLRNIGNFERKIFNKFEEYLMCTLEGEHICGNKVPDELKSLCEKVKNRKEGNFQILRVNY